jgi:hypothetical protein
MDNHATVLGAGDLLYAVYEQNIQTQRSMREKATTIALSEYLGLRNQYHVPAGLRSIHPGCGPGLDQVCALLLGIPNTEGFDDNSTSGKLAEMLWDEDVSLLRNHLSHDPLVTALYAPEQIDAVCEGIVSQRARLPDTHGIARLVHPYEFHEATHTPPLDPGDIMVANGFLYYLRPNSPYYPLWATIDQFAWMVRPGGVATFAIEDDAEGSGNDAIPSHDKRLLLMPRYFAACNILRELLQEKNILNRSGWMSGMTQSTTHPIFPLEEVRENGICFHHLSDKHLSWRSGDLTLRDFLKGTLLFRILEWSDTTGKDVLELATEAFRRIGSCQEVLLDEPFVCLQHFFSYLRTEEPAKGMLPPPPFSLAW